MNGAEAILRSLVQNNVDLCLTNPGTTELLFVDAFERVAAMRSVLVLHEGVATGAADGYGRCGPPLACALLHLGPGLSNGSSFLHDARRARTPLVVLVGEHYSWHLPFDPPLASDIESLARPVSIFVQRLDRIDHLACEIRRAVEMAVMRGGPAVVIVPQEIQGAEVGAEEPRACDDPECPVMVEGFEDETLHRPDPEALARRSSELALRLSGASGVTYLVGSPALSEEALRLTTDLAASLGHDVVLESFPSVLRRGESEPVLEKLPYFPDAVRRALASTSVLVLVGARRPLGFFGYEGQPSELIPDGVEVVTLAPFPSNALEELKAYGSAVAALGAGEGEPHYPPRPTLEDGDRSDGSIDAWTLAKAIVEAQACGDIVVDEGRTGVGPYFTLANAAPLHRYLGHSGGAIGEGMPLGIGAALADPSATVIVIQADGGGMYAPQALWTMVRERLDVKVVVVSNRAYRILQIELRQGGLPLHDRSKAMTSLSDPIIGWVEIARGFGVPAVQVSTPHELKSALQEARSQRGPFLIDVEVVEAR